MSWISQADLLACPAGSVNTALSNLITSTLTDKLSKGKSPQSCRQGGWDRGRSCLNTLPLHSMTNGIWKPLPGLSILLSPCPWDGARRRCSQAEQSHGTLGRAKMGKSELPMLIPGQNSSGSPSWSGLYPKHINQKSSLPHKRPSTVPRDRGEVTVLICFLLFWRPCGAAGALTSGLSHC